MRAAGPALAAATLTVLRAIEGLNGVYDGPPLTGATPYATVETGPEADWSHKSGEGRELRLSILIRDQGEGHDRLRSLVDLVEEAMAEIGPDLTGWRLVNLVFLRGSTLRSKGAIWSAAIEYRARLLKA